jgi:hypothetical protein
MRILKVAAFAVSGYASSVARPCKPFNPLLGETYEADFPERGVRFFAEKVGYLTLYCIFLCKGNILSSISILCEGYNAKLISTEN